MKSYMYLCNVSLKLIRKRVNEKLMNIDWNPDALDSFNKYKTNAIAQVTLIDS